MRFGFTFLSVMAMASTVFSTALRAEDANAYWVEAGPSTLGLSIAPAASVGSRFAVRTPIAIASYNGEFDDSDGNTYDVDVSAFQAAIMADYHPFGNGFRISGGLSLGGYAATGITQSPTYEGLTIPGAVTLDIEQELPIAPVLSIGYTSGARRAISVFGEIGAKYSPYDLTYDTSVTLNAAQRARVDASVAEINDDLDDYAITPFATIGISFSF